MDESYMDWAKHPFIISECYKVNCIISKALFKDFPIIYRLTTVHQPTTRTVPTNHERMLTPLLKLSN